MNSQYIQGNEALTKDLAVNLWEPLVNNKMHGDGTMSFIATQAVVLAQINYYLHNSAAQSNAVNSMPIARNSHHEAMKSALYEASVHQAIQDYAAQNGKGFENANSQLRSKVFVKDLAPRRSEASHVTSIYQSTEGAHRIR